MKRLLFLLISPVLLATPDWAAYAYKATITLAQTTGSADLTDRTNVVYFSDASLKLVANSGQIQHTVTVAGQTVPADLIFTSDSSGLVLLNWDIESYDGSAGNGKVWALVKKTTSHTATTTIYAFWGNSGTTTFQGHNTAGGNTGSAYDAATVAMVPFAGMPGGGTAATLYDLSTYNNNSSLSADYSSGAGLIDGYTRNYGGVSLPAAAQYAITTGTLSGWFNPGTKCTTQGGAWGFMGSVVNVGSSQGLSVGCQGTGSGYIIALASYNDSRVTFTGTVGPTASVWNHIAVTFTSGGTSTFYVNGAAAGTFVPTIGTGSNWLGLNNGTNQWNWYAQNEDDTYFANVLRSADWIAAEYNNGLAPATFAVVSGIGACAGGCGGATANVTLTPIIV